MNKNILAIITARGGSKRIPKKNLKIFNGHPLIFYTVGAAIKSKCLNRVGLSSDSDEIITYCNSIGLNEKYKRPKELSQDNTPSLPVIQDYITWLSKTEKYKPDYIMLLQPTSPLRTTHDIDSSIDLILKNEVDSIVSVTDALQTFTPENILEIEDDLLVQNRTLKLKKGEHADSKYYGRNGAIYLFTYDCLMKKNSLYGDKMKPYIMPQNCSIDIDTDHEFDICEFLIKQREANQTK